MVLDYLEKQAPPVPFTPALEASVARFREMMDELEEAKRIVLINIKGIAERKKDIRQRIANHFAAAAGLIHAYASDQQIVDLKVKVDYTHSDFVRMRDGNLSGCCANICEYAMHNRAALAAYGLSPSLLEVLNQLNTDFEKNYLAPRKAIAKRSSKGEKIAGLISAIDVFFEDVLDRLMLLYRIEPGSYYNGYLISRSIIDPAHIATCMKGTITDEDTGTPVADVKIIVENEEQRFEGRSDKEGNYKVKVPVPGIYNIKMEKEEYAAFIFGKAEIKLGKRTRMDVELTKLSRQDE